MSYGRVTLTDVQQDLSFLEGNQTVPTSGIDDWNRFIQRTLEEAWIQFPWDFAKTTATVSMSNGIGTLASGAMLDSIYAVNFVTGNTGDDHYYEQIDYDESDKYSVGNYRYWVTGNTPNPVINTRETDGILTVWYKSLPPQINASVSATFPDSMVIALGARRFVRMAENPQADVSQEESIFQKRLEEVWGWYNRNKPRRARRRFTGPGTGTVGGD